MKERSLLQAIGIPETSGTEEDLPKLSADFLKEVIIFFRERFPNEEVNKLFVLLSELATEEVVPIWVYRGREVETIIFRHVITFNSSGCVEAGIIEVPRDFAKQIWEDPIEQFCRVVNCASIARDFWAGKLSEDARYGIDTHTQRSQAFQAEALLTLKALAPEMGGGQLRLTPYASFVLDRYPRGLASLPPSLWYETDQFPFIGRDAPGLTELRGPVIKLPYNPEEFLPWG